MTLATTARAPWALLAAFSACLLYACTAAGATDLPQRSWLELAIALVAMAAGAAWLYGNGLRLRASRAGLAGIAALALFAAWAAVSIVYSVAPDRSWAEANTVLAYALTALIGVVLGSSLPRAAERVGLAIGLVMVPVALYALGGKTLPGFHVGEVFSLDHTASFSRLRAPLGYWNALALACVSGLLPLLRLAADPWRRPWPRVAGLLGVLLFVLVLGMTYSRGGVLALVAGLATLLALSTERVRLVALVASALVAAAPPLAIALGRDDLTTDLVPLSQRTDDAAAVAVAVLLAAVLLAAWGRALIALESGRWFTPERGRALGRPAAAVAGALLAVTLAAFLLSGGAARAFDGFKDTKQATGLTDPNRLLSGNSGNRWVWWKEAAGAWSDKPLIGWGAGSFPVTHLLYRKVPLSVRQPHSVPLQWLAEDGLVGFGLAAGGLLALLAAGLARVRSLPWAVSGAPPERGAAAALMAIAAAWSVQSLVEWSWDIPAVTLPMLVSLGVLAARPVRGGARPVRARAGVLAAVAAGFVLFALSAALPAIARTQVDSALITVDRDSPSDAELADAAAQAELAARLNPLSTEALVAAADIATRRRRLDEAGRTLLRAVRREPHDADAWTELARAEFERGNRAGLRRGARRALALDPLNDRRVGFAAQAYEVSLLPGESASATGTPLATQVPLTAP